MEQCQIKFIPLLDNMAKEYIIIKFVPTTHQLIDIFIKPFTMEQLSNIRIQLRLIDLYQAKQFATTIEMLKGGKSKFLGILSWNAILCCAIFVVLNSYNVELLHPYVVMHYLIIITIATIIRNFNFLVTPKLRESFLC